MRKKNRKILIKSSIILISVILFSFLVYGIFYVNTVKETALPDDLVLNRAVFPSISTIAKGIEGNAFINENVDLSKVYQVEFLAEGCSRRVEFYWEGQKVGEFNFKPCDEMFYDNYVHFQKGDYAMPVKGLEKNKYAYSFKVVDLGEATIFFDHGNQVEVGEPVKNFEIRIIEAVSCTRSSHCPLVEVNGKEIKSFCNVKHHCSIDLGEKTIESVEPEVESVETEQLGYAAWKLLMLGGIVGFAVGIVIVKFRRK